MELGAGGVTYGVLMDVRTYTSVIRTCLASSQLLPKAFDYMAKMYCWRRANVLPNDYNWTTVVSAALKVCWLCEDATIVHIEHRWHQRVCVGVLSLPVASSLSLQIQVADCQTAMHLLAMWVSPAPQGQPPAAPLNGIYTLC